MTVLIIGGGVSGTACALHLWREHGILATVIEPRADLGVGVAYSTQDPAHRINVPARLMSIFADDPTHFDRWLRDTGELSRDPAMRTEDDRLFPARAVFGRYMAELSRDVAHIRASAASAARVGETWRVTLDDGRVLAADTMVLATSHPASALPRALAGIDDPRVVQSPWGVDFGQVDPAATVAIVGTGLTMADTVSSLRAGGHRGAIVAISRRGLMPRRRTLSVITPLGMFAENPARTAGDLVSRVRQAMQGEPWERVIEALRQQAPAVWQALPVVERRRFLRHIRPFWDAHRYPCAPMTDDLLREGLGHHWLRVVAGSLMSVERMPAGLALTVRRHGGGIERIEAALVVNCTGPAHASVVAGTRVLAALAAAGALAEDPTNLGILTDGRGRVLNAEGSVTPGLFVAGPLARGAYGELIGLPQVSDQPRAVAAEIAAYSVSPVTLATA